MCSRCMGARGTSLPMVVKSRPADSEEGGCGCLHLIDSGGPTQRPRVRAVHGQMGTKVSFRWETGNESQHHNRQKQFPLILIYFLFFIFRKRAHGERGRRRQRERERGRENPKQALCPEQSLTQGSISPPELKSRVGCSTT